MNQARITKAGLAIGPAVMAGPGKNHAEVIR